MSVDEEREILAHVAQTEFRPVVIRGQAARRTARHYGVEYDYEARGPLAAGEPLPAWLEPLRERSARLAGTAAQDLAEALLQRYPAGATIGWHRDAPGFGTVVGVSFAGPCRLRLRRSVEGEWLTHEVALEPRSAYVLDGQARWSWQHSIPPTPALRYSLTFRTLRSRSGATRPGPGQPSQLDPA